MERPIPGWELIQLVQEELYIPFNNVSKDYMSIATSPSNLGAITWPCNVEYTASVGFLQRMWPLSIQIQKCKFTVDIVLSLNKNYYDAYALNV
jgi:hypothetical protein